MILVYRYYTDQFLTKEYTLQFGFMDAKSFKSSIRDPKVLAHYDGVPKVVACKGSKVGRNDALYDEYKKSVTNMTTIQIFIVIYYNILDTLGNHTISLQLTYLSLYAVISFQLRLVDY